MTDNDAARPQDDTDRREGSRSAPGAGRTPEQPASERAPERGAEQPRERAADRRAADRSADRSDGFSAESGADRSDGRAQGRPPERAPLREEPKRSAVQTPTDVDDAPGRPAAPAEGAAGRGRGTTAADPADGAFDRAANGARIPRQGAAPLGPVPSGSASPGSVPSAAGSTAQDGHRPPVEPASAPTAAAAQDAALGATGGMLDEEQVRRLTAQWRAAQTGFVDDPREAVEQADALVGQAVRLVTDSLDGRRRRLRGSDGRAPDQEGVPTEELRLAMREYRTLLDRLLAA